jgi:hypothetical protein
MKYLYFVPRARFEKFERLAKDTGLTLVDTHNFLGYSHVPCNLSLANKRDKIGLAVGCGKCWPCMFRQDSHLNNVPIARFDHIINAYWVYHRHDYIVADRAEMVALYKHLVITQIVRAGPVFEED